MLRAIYVFILVTLSTHLHAQSQQQPAPTAYHIIGRCHDYGTAVGLKASLYAVVEGRRQKLGEGAEAGQAEPKAGTFDLILPTKATHLVVEMKGYHTLTIPVHFTTGIPAEARFAVYNLVAMTPLDSLPSTTVSEMVDFLSLCYVETDTISQSQDTWLELTSSKSSKRYITPSPDRTNVKMSHFPMLPGAYTATLSTADGRVISKEKFSVGTGVTFKAVRVGKKPDLEVTKAMVSAKPVPPSASSSADTVSQTDVAIISVPAVATSSTTTLYFDQSSPDLRTQTRATLDSLIPILKAQSNLMATVTGYTDNVGQRNLNLTLSEYRARAVATYLTGRGVPPGQLVVRWKGPDSTTAPGDSEAVKTKSRRVLIQVAPR